jgi:hypothetical protein
VISIVPVVLTRALVPTSPTRQNQSWCGEAARKDKRQLTVPIVAWCPIITPKIKEGILDEVGLPFYHDFINNVDDKRFCRAGVRKRSRRRLCRSDRSRRYGTSRHLRLCESNDNEVTVVENTGNSHGSFRRTEGTRNSNVELWR